MDENSIFADVETTDLSAPTPSEDYTNQTLSPMPDRSITTLADYIYPALQKQYIAIITHEADVSANGDVEAIHQMRVSLRRLRSMMRAFAPMLDVPKVMGDKPIGKIAQILGKVRDLDVLQDTCKTYRVDLPTAERSYLDEAISTLAKRRRKAMFKVQSMFDEKEYQYFKLALNNWLNHPQYTQTIDVPIELILPSLLLSLVEPLFLHSGWWIDANSQDVDNPEVAVDRLLDDRGTIFHQLRKQVKGVRYLMELFPDRYSAEYDNYLQDFKQIHKLFGNIQDGIVLDNFLQRVLGKRAATKLPTIYDRIAQDNYLNWQQWEVIQHRYRSLAVRQELQSFLIRGTIQSS